MLSCVFNNVNTKAAMLVIAQAYINISFVRNLEITCAGIEPVGLRKSISGFINHISVGNMSAMQMSLLVEYAF